MTSQQCLPLAGYAIRSMPSVHLSAQLRRRMDSADRTALLFANTNFVLQCEGIRDWVNSDEVILVNDGVGLDIAAKWLHGQRFAFNLNGTDFLPFLLQDLPRPYKIFLMGAKPGVAEKAGEVIARRFGHAVVGCLDGYVQLPPAMLHQKINASGADIVLVAMGNPRQEQWIHDNMPQLSATLLMGVGAGFDFLAGGVRRAPLWVQRARLEWLFRLAQEPRRLAKRYSIDIVRFLLLCRQHRA